MAITKLKMGMVQSTEESAAVRVGEDSLVPFIPQEEDVSEIETASFDQARGVLTIRHFNGQEIQISGFYTPDRIPAGPTGPQGPRGKDGKNGRNGKNGRDGGTGCSGPQGAIGQTGPKGEQGWAGPQGPVGPTGPQGPIGDTGPTGPRGPQGPIGETGEPGDPGPLGEPGPQGPPSNMNIVFSATQPEYKEGLLWVNPTLEFCDGGFAPPEPTPPPPPEVELRNFRLVKVGNTFTGQYETIPPTAQKAVSKQATNHSNVTFVRMSSDYPVYEARNLTPETAPNFVATATIIVSAPGYSAKTFNVSAPGVLDIPAPLPFVNLTGFTLTRVGSEWRGSFTVHPANAQLIVSNQSTDHAQVSFIRMEGSTPYFGVTGELGIGTNPNFRASVTVAVSAAGYQSKTFDVSASAKIPKLEATVSWDGSSNSEVRVGTITATRT